MTLTLGRPSTATPRGALKLTVVSGPDVGMSVVVPRETAMIGRAEGADLRLTDRAVSWFHVELRTKPEGIGVRDVESHNGTYCGGVRLDHGMVAPGSPLEIGS